MIEPNPATIPAELQVIPQWVCWRLEARKDKPTKVPYTVDGRQASSTDPKTWSRFLDALSAWSTGDYAGIGFVVSAGDPYCGVDLDHCRKPETGAVEPWAQQIVKALQSYTEVTPSATGLRVWVRGALPEGKRRKGDVEMYESGRYFTVTGCHLEGTPRKIEERQPELTALHGRIFAEPVAVSSPEPPPKPEPKAVLDLDDEQLLAKAERAKNGDRFAALWRGDCSAYPSQSEADIALCSMLAFWTQKDADRIDRLFRRSGLLRPKWDERHHSSGETYGAGTIAEALRLTREVYQPGAPLPLPSPSLNGVAPATAVHLPPAQPQGRPWPSPIDEAAYHGIAGDVVRTIDPHSEADPVAILMTFLVVAGNMIGRDAYAVAESDRHGCNLFACLVGPSAKARKGASWGRIREIAERVDSRWLADRVGGGLSSGEGLINAVRDAVRNGDVVVADGIDDKRWLAQESEMGSVLKRSVRDGNTLSDILRIAWDGGTLRTLTKGSPLKATRPHISILGHITRDDLLKHLNDTEVANGFANRFLWFAVRRSKELPEGGGDVELNAIVHRLNEILARARTLGRIQRDPTARAIWADVYHQLSADKPGLLGAVTARAEAQVLRLSVLYAALDCSSMITDAHLLAALAVWDYAERSAKWIFGDAIGDVLADRILDTLRQVPDGLAKSAIHALLGRNQSAPRLDAALGTLLSLGRVRRERQDGGNGRSQEVWIAQNS